MSEVQVARIQAKQADKDRLLAIAQTVLSNPVLTGLTGIALNEAAYRMGFYDKLADEKEESILGGPVWITIGPTLPVSQQRRNLINGFIIAACTAWAAGGLIRSVGDFSMSKLLAGASK